MEELDEFGIPIKKESSEAQPQFDEFGIPLKKKEESQPLNTSSTESSKGTATGTNPIKLGLQSALEDYQINSPKAKDNKFITETAKKLNVAPTREAIYAKTAENISKRAESDYAELEQTNAFKTLQTTNYKGQNITEVYKGFIDEINTQVKNGSKTPEQGKKDVEYLVNDLSKYASLQEKLSQNVGNLKILNTASAPKERPSLLEQAQVGVVLPAMDMITRLYPEMNRQAAVVANLLQGRSWDDAIMASEMYVREKEPVSAALLQKSDLLQKAQTDYAKLVQDARPDEKNWKENIRQITEDAVASMGYSIPLIAAYTTGNPALAATGNYALFNQSAGSRWDAIKDDPNKTTKGKFLDATFHGMSEVLFEQLGAIPTAGLYKEVGKKLSKDQFLDLFKEANKTATKKWLETQGIALGFVGEGVEELWTGMGQRASDYLTMKEKPKDDQGNEISFEQYVYDKNQMMNEFITGTAMGTVMSAPGGVVNAYTTIRDSKKREQVKDLESKLATLQGDISSIKEEDSAAKDALVTEANKLHETIVKQSNEDFSEWEDKPKEIKDKADYLIHQNDELQAQLSNPEILLSENGKAAIEKTIEENNKGIEELKSIDVPKIEKELNETKTTKNTETEQPSTESVGVSNISEPSTTSAEKVSIIGAREDMDFTAKGGNKIVDEKGEPITLFHGTNNDKIKFDEGTVFYATIDKKFADVYGENHLPVKMALKNPYDLTDSADGIIKNKNGTPMLDEKGIPYSINYIDESVVKDLKNRGFDGVRMGNESIVAFDKSQVKSAQPKTESKLNVEQITPANPQVFNPKKTKRKKSSIDKIEATTPEDFIAQKLSGAKISSRSFRDLKGPAFITPQLRMKYLNEKGVHITDIAADLIREGGVFENMDEQSLTEMIGDFIVNNPAGVDSYAKQKLETPDPDLIRYNEEAAWAEEEAKRLDEEEQDMYYASAEDVMQTIDSLSDEEYDVIMNASLNEDELLTNIENGKQETTRSEQDEKESSESAGQPVSEKQRKPDLEKAVKEAKSVYQSAQNKLSKAKESAGKAGAEQQMDLMGNKPADALLFGSDIKAIGERIRELEEEVSSAKETLDKAQTALENFVPDNQLQIQELEDEKKSAKTESKKQSIQEKIDKLKEATPEGPIVVESGGKRYSALSPSKKIVGKRIEPSPIKSSKVKKLDEIVLDLTKGVKKDILFSKKPSSRRSLGSYNPMNAATKIKYREDLDVTAHEIGHALDDRYGLLSNVPADKKTVIESELGKFSEFGSKPPKNHPDPKMYEMGEGVAEWIRAYVMNPEAAEKAAPEFTAWYKQTVPADIQNGITDFSNDVRAFAGATNIEKMKSAIGFDASKKKGSLLDFLKPTVSNEDGFKLTFFDRLASKFTNPMRATDVAFKFAMGEKGVTEVLPENDPRVLAKLFLGFNDKMDNMFEQGLVDKNNNRIKDPVTGKPITIEWLLEPMDASSESELKSESEDMIAFMVAERINEKYDQFAAENAEAKEQGKPIPHPNIENLVNVGGGIFKNMDVVRGTLADMETMRNEDPQKYARIQEGARRYRVFADEIMKYQVEKGRLSPSEYKEIKDNNAYYVGLGRIMDAGPNEEIVSGSGKSGALGSVADFNSFKGSNRMIKNPYEFLLETAYKSVKEADRNDVMRAFVDMVQSERKMYEGEPNKLATVARPASEGDPNTITVFVGGEKQTWQFDDDVYATLKNLQDVAYNLPWIATAIPSLLRATVTNFPVFAARNRVRDFQSRLILSKSGTKLEDLFNKPEDIKDRYQLFGAGQAGYYLTDEGFYYKRLEQATQDLAGTNIIVIHPYDVAKHGWESYQKLLSSSERATRLEEYNAAYRKAKKEGFDDYNANLYAAYQARDLMDFAVMGTWMRYINQVIPFSNAAVQGLRKAFNTAAENPSGFATRLVLYSVVPALITRMMASMFGDDDDWYKKLPSWQRDLYYNFKVGDNKIVAIPKPYELGILGAFADRMVDRMLGDKKAFEGHSGTVAQSFFPFDEGTLAGPAGAFVELAANYDFFRNKNIIPPDEQKLMIELRNTEYASRLGKVIQETMGVDARKADFLVKRLASYYGDLAIKLSNIGAEGKENDFGWTTTGFVKGDNPLTTRDAQWIIKQAEEYGINEMSFFVGKSNPLFQQYVVLKSMGRAYYEAKSDKEKQEIANTTRDYAERVRESWEKELPKYKEYLLQKKELKSKK